MRHSVATHPLFLSLIFFAALGSLGLAAHRYYFGSIERLECSDNRREFGRLLVEARETRGWPEFSGSAFLLQLYEGMQVSSANTSGRIIGGVFDTDGKLWPWFAKPKD